MAHKIPRCVEWISTIHTPEAGDSTCNRHQPSRIECFSGWRCGRAEDTGLGPAQDIRARQVKAYVESGDEIGATAKGPGRPDSATYGEVCRRSRLRYLFPGSHAASSRMVKRHAGSRPKVDVCCAGFLRQPSTRRRGRLLAAEPCKVFRVSVRLPAPAALCCARVPAALLKLTLLAFPENYTLTSFKLLRYRDRS